MRLTAHRLHEVHLLHLVGALLAVQSAMASESSNNSEQDLIEALGLLNGIYKSAVRAPPDNGSANSVSVFFNINTLVKVDSAAQEITIQLWLNKYWVDRRLAWRGQFNSSFDNLTAIFVPASLLWQPDVGFYKLLQFQESPDNLVGKVRPDGLVTVVTEIIATTKCTMDMNMFPYDKQTCYLFVSSNIHETRTMKLRVHSYREHDSLTQFLKRSNEFCIMSVEAASSLDDYYDLVTLTIVIQRKTTFFLVNLIMPSLLLLAISSLTFRLPPECGERVSFSVTIVLSMCVFLQLTGNYIPAQSDSVPLITCYYSLAIIMMMASVLVNALLVSCHLSKKTTDGDNARVKSRLIRLLFLNRFLTRRQSVQKDSSQPDNPQPTESSLNGELQSTDPKESTSSATFAAGDEWKLVAESVDYCCFAVFIGIWPFW